MKRGRQIGDTICPFVEKPFDNCFVNRLTSSTIKEVVAFCGKNYEACKIYRSSNGLEQRNEQKTLIQ